MKSFAIIYRLSSKSHKKLICFLFVVFSFGWASTYAQSMPGMKMDTSANKHKGAMNMQNQQMLPMAFFTHMGIPLNVGTYGLRLAMLQTQYEGKSKTQFNFQFETGLSKTVGLFIGGEKLFDDPNLETMFQFLVIKSKNGMSGLSPIIEFEFPLGKEATRHVYTQVGFASTLSNSHVAFNQVLHYSPLEDLAEGSVSAVIKVSKRIFIVSEISGVVEKNTRPVFNLLGGIKVKFNDNFFLGIGYQAPLTENREYSSQYVFQPNIMFQK
jgi:hypothetical protein